MKHIAKIIHEEARCITLVMAFVFLALGLVAVLLASLLRLDACHLCIFQRLAYFVISVTLFLAFLGWGKLVVRQLSLIATISLCVWGLVVSAQQSWLQWFPESLFDCRMGETGVAERVIDWLGQLYPLFFMATGFCGSKDLVIFGLTLANWSFLILLVFSVCCAILFLQNFNMKGFRISFLCRKKLNVQLSPVKRSR